MQKKNGSGKSTRLGNCGKAGYKHCPAAICILYEVGGMSTPGIMRMLGVTSGSIDRLVKKGRLHIRKNPVCEASIVILYTMTGLGMERIAQTIGTSTSRIHNTLRAKGIDTSARKAPESMARHKVNELYGGKFYVVEAQYGHEGRSLIRCNRCGHEFTRYKNALGRLKCPECEKAEKAEKERKAKEERKKTLEQARIDELGIDKTCSECGEVFHSEYPTARYCSDRCKSKAKHARQFERDPDKIRKKRRDSRKNNKLWQKVARRDGMECSICGEPCDPNDLRWNGTRGPLYPSLDHVLARANGGADSPDNYRLAHIICNSIKGDNELTDEIREAARSAVAECAVKEAC